RAIRARCLRRNEVSRLVLEHQAALHENPTDREEGEGIRMTTVPSNTVKTSNTEHETDGTVRRMSVADFKARARLVDLMSVEDAAATYGLDEGELQAAVD